MSEHRAKLQSLLRELFQFDAADLDFGIYRIMNQRRADIDAFIQTGLLDAVAREFQVLDAQAIAEKKVALERTTREVRAAFGDNALDAEGNFAFSQFAQLPLALQYTAKKDEMAQVTASTEAEKDIFNALYTFFSRYYDGGDFITKRRYSRKEKYAIPYNGEEVYFHWANRDQYYVKTADVLTDYAFRIESHGGYRVCFKLAAANTEQNNVKGEKRFFMPTPLSLVGGGAGGEGLAQYDADRRELTFRFEYRPLAAEEIEEYGKNGAQAKILQASRDPLLKAVPDTILRGLLATPPTADDDRTLLDLHLYRWTRKSTSDFFIHKDLRGFLERELGFYLKNEVMRLDDLDITNAARAASYLTRLAVIKSTGNRIIEFLAQIEDFQKRLFEKPKFVLASEWCVTLDRVPESLHSAILANDAQWQEWERLFGIQKPKGNGKRAQAFLVEHPTLTVDTALYDADIKDQLLSALSDTEGGLAAQTDGLLIHSENFQALALLQLAFRERVKCIYIDPPYNTGSDGFVYKDSFQHSTWLAMMEDRLCQARDLLSVDGVIFVSIDDNEVHNLRTLMDSTFRDQFVSNIAVVNNLKGRSDRKHIATAHEHLLMYATQGFESFGLELSPEQVSQFSETDENNNNFQWRDLRKRGGADSRQERPNLFFPVYYNQKTDQFSLEPSRKDDITIYPLKSDGVEGCWRWGKEKVASQLHNLKATYVEQSNRWNIAYKVYLEINGEERTAKPKSVWIGSQYATDLGQRALKKLLPNADLGSPPKAVGLIEEILEQSTRERDVCLDFFAGSGTTAHSVINLNREDEGQRKYILVEQGDDFDTVLKPRIQKVIYASEWKDGQPVEGAQGSSHALQYLRLESYEDTLDNLDLATETTPAPGLFLPEHDDYLLKYVLDHETRRARLNIELFTTPFDYELRVRRNGAQKRVKVDLVETASFLLGLTVTARRAYTHQNRAYRVVLGAQGNESIAVIWRNTADLDLKQEAEFVAQEILVPLPDRIYINGDSHIPGAQPIEDVFMQVMRGESRHA